MRKRPLFSGSWRYTLLPGGKSTSQNSSKNANYYPAINTLRTVSALFVCLYHFTWFSDCRGNLIENEILRGVSWLGCYGVSIFFVISGFALPLSLARDNFQGKDTFRYLLKRFIRIEVPYICSIGLVLLVNFAWEFSNGALTVPDAKRLLYHLFYVIPFTHYEWYNVIYWTLALEFQFYLLVVPLYFLLSSKNLFLRYCTLFLFIISGLVFTDLRLLTSYSGVFGAGLLLFLIKTGKIGKWPAVLFFALCLVTAFLQLSLGTCIAVLLAFVIILRDSFDFAPARLTGEMSYSFYLTHGLVGGNIIQLSGFYSEQEIYRIVIVFLALLGSLLFAWFYWFLIERPSKRWSERIFDKFRKDG